jgi:hypothetical protein
METWSERAARHHAEAFVHLAWARETVRAHVDLLMAYELERAMAAIREVRS